MNKIYYAFSCFLMTACVAYAERTTLIMPKELVDVASDNKCSMVDDFYNRPAIEYPIFSKGRLGKDSTESFIFWCKTENEKTPYSLIIRPINSQGKYPCPLEIKWWNYPGGLYIDKAKEYKLSEFKYLNSPSKSGPDAPLDNNAIYSNYDGVIGIFYCYEGEWLYKILH